jgi:ribosomal protein L40E
MYPMFSPGWEKQMKQCGQCGKENAPEAQFCRRCGSSDWGGTKCEKCGKLNPSDSQYCSHCGLQLGAPDNDRPRGVTRDAQHLGDIQARRALSEDGFAGWFQVQSINRPRTAARGVGCLTIFVAVGVILLILSMASQPDFSGFTVFSCIALGLYLWFYVLIHGKR